MVNGSKRYSRDLRRVGKVNDNELEMPWFETEADKFTHADRLEQVENEIEHVFLENG